jgi:hypothetical protein
MRTDESLNTAMEYFNRAIQEARATLAVMPA